MPSSRTPWAGPTLSLCYNADDPRGFAFWSKPQDWVGRDAILVTVGEPDGQQRYFARWFARVEPVTSFWVERSGKPVRRIELYRCIQQRFAFPFVYDRGERIARVPPQDAGTQQPTAR